MPNSTMPSGIQAIGAIGASPRTSGITMSENEPDAEIRMPVAIAAAKPMASPASTRNALTRSRPGSAWRRRRSRPGSRSRSRNCRNADGGGNRTEPLQPLAAASSQIAMTTAQGTSALKRTHAQDGTTRCAGASATGALGAIQRSSTIAHPSTSFEQLGVDDRRRRLEIAELHHVGDRDLHALVAALGDVDLRHLPRQRGCQDLLVDAVELRSVEDVDRLGHIGLDRRVGAQEGLEVLLNRRPASLRDTSPWCW